MMYIMVYIVNGGKDTPLNRFKTRIERQLNKNQHCMQGDTIGIIKLSIKFNVEIIDISIPETHDKKL
jgi:hypothetical protein